MFLRSANHLMTFLLSYYVWKTSKFRSPSGSRGFRGYPNIRSLEKSTKFISSRAKVTGRSHDQHFIVNFVVMSRNVMSCHVMPRHVMSCHVLPRHVTSCHVKSRHVTSCHVISCHIMQRHATSCHITSCHVMPRHATSSHVMLRHDT